LLGRVSNIERNWRVVTETRYGDQQSHAGILGMGNDGTYRCKIEFTNPMEQIIGHDINLTSSSAYSHAEWVSCPWFEDERHIEADVHWGVSYNHTVEFQPWATGIKFLPHGKL